MLAKEAKKRREVCGRVHRRGPAELAAKEEAEFAILETYLPAQLSDDELASIVAAAIDADRRHGYAELGQVMKAANAVVAGRADGGRVAAVVKATLAAR